MVPYRAVLRCSKPLSDALTNPVLLASPRYRTTLKTRGPNTAHATYVYTSQACLHAQWPSTHSNQAWKSSMTRLAWHNGPLSGQRYFSQSQALPKDHHFDTLKVVERLKEEGFSEEQAISLMRVLNDVIEESILNLTRTMVLREDQEKATYTQKVDFAKLRSELLSADSTESSLTRTSHDRLTNEIAKLNSRLRDDVQRTMASVRLDLNLEKGRIREEANAQDMKLKETETKIEQEVSLLRERLEAVKFSTLQWIMQVRLQAVYSANKDRGVCTGAAALFLAVWRLIM